MRVAWLRPLRFGIVGLLNTGVGLGVIFAAKAGLSLGDLASNVLGYGVGLLLSFFLNRRWTFLSSSRISPALGRFILAFGAAYGLNLLTVFGLRDLAHVNAYLAQAVGVVPYTLFFYLASTHFVFPEDRTLQSR